MEPGTRRTYSCPVCGLSYSRRYRLAFHERNVHSQEEELGTHCNICDGRFATRYGLKQHQKRVHAHEVKKQCRECNKGVFSNRDLQEHMRREHAAPKFSCENCQMQFSKKWNFQRHKKTCLGQSNEKTFACIQCNSQFKYKRNLDSHIRIKHSPSNFVCEKCGKAFERKYSHSRHLKNVHRDD